MNALENRLDYPFGETVPSPGTAHQVAPGVFWIRMPLPFALDHINVWLLRDVDEGREGWTIIDCGITNASTQASWEQLFESLLDGLPVLRVLVTHFHPDHFGLAWWLCEGGDRKRWQARLWMSHGEYMQGRVSALMPGSSAGGAAAAEHFGRHGMADPVVLEQITQRVGYYTTLVPRVPEQFRRISDGDTVTIGGRGWRIITGFGHSPEHCALYCDALGVLISGDMVLPRISTNVSVYDIEPESDPLGLFLKSLRRYEDLPGDTLVLPSHGKPFRGLQERLEQLAAHHRARLDEVRAECAKHSCSAADIVPIMFHRKLDAHQVTFAMGEALAHLHLLWLSGELRREVDAAGRVRFAPLSAALA